MHEKEMKQRIVTFWFKLISCYQCKVSCIMYKLILYMTHMAKNVNFKARCYIQNHLRIGPIGLYIDV